MSKKTSTVLVLSLITLVAVLIVYTITSLIENSWKPTEWSMFSDAETSGAGTGTGTGDTNSPDYPSSSDNPQVPPQGDTDDPVPSEDKGEYRIWHTHSWADSMTETGPEGYTAPEFQSVTRSDAGATVTYKITSTDSRVKVSRTLLYIMPKGGAEIESIGNKTENSFTMPDADILINLILSYVDGDGNTVDRVSDREKSFLMHVKTIIQLAKNSTHFDKYKKQYYYEADRLYSNLSEYEKSHDAMQEVLRAYQLIVDADGSGTLTDTVIAEAEMIVTDWKERIEYFESEPIPEPDENSDAVTRYIEWINYAVETPSVAGVDNNFYIALLRAEKCYKELTDAEKARADVNAAYEAYLQLNAMFEDGIINYSKRLSVAEQLVAAGIRDAVGALPEGYGYKYELKFAVTGVAGASLTAFAIEVDSNEKSGQFAAFKVLLKEAFKQNYYISNVTAQCVDPVYSYLNSDRADRGIYKTDMGYGDVTVTITLSLKSSQSGSAGSDGLSEAAKDFISKVNLLLKTYNGNAIVGMLNDIDSSMNNLTEADKATKQVEVASNVYLGFASYYSKGMLTEEVRNVYIQTMQENGM